jgi:hypothetical protein
MGFSFKKKWKQILVGAGSGGLLPGFAEIMMTDKGKDIVQDIHKGVGNLVSGGYINQVEATKQSKQARDDAAAQYAAEQAAAEATARKIAETEEERKRRLALQGTQTPSTLINSYLGLPGRTGTSRGTLG